MIELPRRASSRDRIAEVADFFSFGTNDLTQTALGFSRDDVEGKFLAKYLEQKIVDRSPFETIDRPGVGWLVRLAAWVGRERKPELQLGICGEHGGDPDSIDFFHMCGLDYVSCSPYRVRSPACRRRARRDLAPGLTRGGARGQWRALPQSTAMSVELATGLATPWPSWPHRRTRHGAPAEDDSPVRTPFQRDRDRIVHSKAFRRLGTRRRSSYRPRGTTTTRLTHTIETGMIARTVARALGLNEDLTEAIALGHDLGHPPFGHIGESVLDACMKERYGRRLPATTSTRRAVERLERDGRGLNLTEQVRDGILNHTGPTKPATLEDGS